MYQKGNYYRNKRYYTNKGLTIQKKPQDPPKIIDQYYVPIYRNYFLKTRELMPYTPGIAYIDFKKRNDPTQTIGDFILDEVLAYGKNLTDITKIEIDPELDFKVRSQTYTKVTIFDTTNDIFTPSQYGIWSHIQYSGAYDLYTTNNCKYTFTVIEGGWNIEMSPGVNELTTSGEISVSENNINSTGNVSDTKYEGSTTSPIQNEYKGYTRDVSGNILPFHFISGIYAGGYNYSMLQVKIYF